MRTILPSNDTGFLTIAQTSVSTTCAPDAAANPHKSRPKDKARFITRFSTPTCKHYASIKSSGVKSATILLNP
jgi:hypothetical protein